MTDEQEVERIVAYLRQHSDRYDLAALHQQLVAAGQPLSLIDAATARLQTTDSTSKRRRWPWTLMIAIGNFFAVAIVAYGLELLLTWLSGQQQSAISIAIFLLLAQLVAGLSLLFTRYAWLGRGLLLGVLFTVAAAAVLLIISIIMLVIGLLTLAGDCLTLIRDVTGW